MHKHLGSWLLVVLLNMCRSGQFFPIASWVIPLQSSGMDHIKVAFKRTCILLPKNVELQNIVNIFFNFIFVSSTCRYCALNEVVETMRCEQKNMFCQCKRY
jgi:hypothetical protein